MDNQSGISKGDITIRNTGSANGNAVTPASTVTLQCGGSYSSAIIQITGTYTGALTVQVTLDGTNWVNLSGTTSIVNVATKASVGSFASATTGVFQVDVAGVQGVRVSAIAGAMTGTATVSIQAGAGTGIVSIDTPVVLGASTAAIGTISTPAGTAISVTSAASTNASSQKASAGNLFEITVSNPTATPAYVKLYNKASAPTVGTDVPVLTIVAPATAATQSPSVISLNFGQIGKRFATGIAMAITGGVAATDTTNAVAGVQVHGTYV